MLQIKITEAGQKELQKVDFDIEGALDRIIEFIPKLDLVGLGYIYITDKPINWKKRLNEAFGSYFQKHNNAAAYIEIYIEKLFSHIKSVDSFKLMIPIQNIGLAQTLFHEVGHHVEKTRSHGIKKNKREKFADNYMDKLLLKHLNANAESIEACFKNLEEVADEKGLSKDIIKNMKNGWKKQHQGLIN